MGEAASKYQVSAFLPRITATVLSISTTLAGGYDSRVERLVLLLQLNISPGIVAYPILSHVA